MDSNRGALPRAVLFDFGGVITTSPFESFAIHEATHDLPEGLIRAINATNPDTNAWARLERSEVGIDEFVDLFEAEARARGHRIDGHEVLGCLSGEIRPQMVEALQRLNGDFLLGLLTNNFVAADVGDPPIGHVEIIGLFDAVIQSSVVGCRKPDPRFYALALEQLGIEAREAVFLDDLGINLKPARAMGMATIKVVDPDVALAELDVLVGGALS